MPLAMVVEDNQKMSDTLCMMLRILGIDTRPALTPRSAILQLENQRPDVMFLDLNLPGVDGFEVLAYIRRDPRMAQIPAIIVTSNDQPDTYQRAAQGGVAAVIIKPPTIEALQQALIQASVLR